QELKERSFMLLCVQAQLHFMRGADGGGLEDLQGQVEALAQEMSSELEEHLQLCQELATAKEDAARIQQLCEEELKDLAEDSEGDSPETKRRRSNFDDEEDTLAELNQMAAAEEAEIGRLQRLSDFEEQLGMPRIDMEEDQVTLGRPNEETEALCTVQVQWDHGRLLRAEPHPALRLDREAQEAVAAEDLGRLLGAPRAGLCLGSHRSSATRSVRACPPVCRACGRLPLAKGEAAVRRWLTAATEAAFSHFDFTSIKRRMRNGRAGGSCMHWS
ncbi:unnamed protein product, partial [Effrenium voratum]